MRITSARVRASTKWWFSIGVALLVYCVVGNWLVLPGYRRFLEGGSAGGEASGLALAWGAARTILWMLSFHIGALCIAFASLSARGEETRRFRRGFALGAVAWIGLWAVPSLPGPYTLFFASTGIAILLAICIVFAKTTGAAGRDGSFFSTFGDGRWQIASYFFFALATWDMCGLGSVGGILHPDGAVRNASHTLVVTQTTKLIAELAIAWGLLAIAPFAEAAKRQVRAPSSAGAA